MKKQIIAATILMLLGAAGSIAQTSGYKFTEVVSVPATSVKNQSSTGTCWCFATTSFMESELLRKGKGEYDLSEMFIVRQKYLNQMEDYFLRRGHGNVGEGSLSHTWANAFCQVGIVPEEVYHGIMYDSQTHNHNEMQAFIQAMADASVQRRKRSPEYYKIVNSILDIYLGPVPETFTYKGKSYTPKTFAASLGLNMEEYVEITSFSHKPFYKQMEVEVPDNWEHALQYNVPLDELEEVMDYALLHGYSVCWDGDVSEQGFGGKVAVNPLPQNREEALKFQNPCPEIDVTQEVRQEGYENFSTTDDHLMHITGIVKDQNGTKYYVTKNSWGTGDDPSGGYVNMSESYVRAKVIYILVHKDAVPAAIKAKLGI